MDNFRFGPLNISAPCAAAETLSLLSRSQLLGPSVGWSDGRFFDSSHKRRWAKEGREGVREVRQSRQNIYPTAIIV